MFRVKGSEYEQLSQATPYLNKPRPGHNGDKVDNLLDFLTETL